ncbi:OmpA family protein [Winogradskyella maritima]|uniref:OmpA family protein n=1 Tax=Winogradskyella maritima TaxID=1517766 RepID=A0ABV8AIW7_9FLAO|nr:OmpA family protein [Winogradskyella maritima]
MKRIYTFFTVALLLAFSTNSMYAQTENDPWAISLEVNAVDVYPVNEDAPQGPYFDEFFNLTDHWNIGFPKLTVSRYLGNNFSIQVGGSYNKISKWGELPGDESVAVDDLTYIGVDGMINYSLTGLFNTTKFDPYIGLGGGYTWIEEGQFNTFSTAGGTDNLVGAGTVNGTVGIKYWFADAVAVNLQTMYKHSFQDYLTPHAQHSLGIVVQFGGPKEDNEPEEAEVIDTDGDGIPDETDACPTEAGPASTNGCPDSDGDGVADKDDECPTVAGLQAYDGCPDTDGDGYPDNIDECPTVSGTENGCPAKEEEVEETTPAGTTTKAVTFAFDESYLDGDAKEKLDELVNMADNSIYNITVEGHTDSIGSNAYNQGLGMRRAQAVKDYLVSKGLSENLITITSEGETEPVASNNTDAGRAQNRRSEVTITITSN